MTVVKSTMPAYQGSGLETSSNVKPVNEIKPVDEVRTEGEKRPAAPPIIVSEKRPASETKPVAEEKSPGTPVAGGRMPEPDTRTVETKKAQQHEALKRAVEQINRKARYSEAVFDVHDETNRITVKIIDKDTKEVIREFPPEKTLDMIAKVWELAGLMLDERG